MQETDLKLAYRTTPTGLYLFSTLRDGRSNVQFAFRALGVSEDPPLLIVGVQHSNYSLETIQQTREFVLNVCSEEQLHAIDRSRGLHGNEVEDKFALLGLEAIPARHVKVPMVAGCHANVECEVVGSMPTDGGVTIFLARALACHVDPSRPPVGRLAGKNYRLGGPI